MNEAMIDARRTERARWSELKPPTRRIYWYHFAQVLLFPVVAVGFLALWTVAGWWWLPIGALSVSGYWVWLLAILWILRHSGLDLVQRRKMFVALNNVASTVYDLGVFVVLSGIWLFGDEAHSHWAVPIAAGLFLIAGAIDAQAAWSWRKCLPAFPRRSVSTAG